MRFVELVWMPFVDESLRDLASVRQAANLITQFKALNLNFPGANSEDNRLVAELPKL